MKDDQKRAFLAVVLSGLILFGWQYFFAPKEDFTKTMKSKKETSKNNIATEKVKNNIDISETSKAVESPSYDIEKFTLSNKKSSYTLDNSLAVLDAISFENNSEFKNYFNENAFSMFFKFGDVFEKLSFQVVYKSNTKIELKNEKHDLSLIINLNKKGFLNYQFNSTKEFSFKISYFKDHSGEDDSSMLAFSQPKSLFGYFSDDYNTLQINSEDSGESQFKWASIDNEYHMLATIFPSKVPVLYKTTEDGKFSFFTNNKTKTLNIDQIFTRKEYDYLKTLGNNLDLSIDFGIWSIIAVPILRGLQFFYSIFPNYGISIILLTIIIRLLTFPLQYKSFKSMKKMQQIQPQLNKVRERFKDNPQKMQKETMALFKKSGANPIGGCLPMLLQMPIFFAFYRVLYSSVELVDAPFFLWIHDLSHKDPYYILPVLMAVAMVLNQKLMPTTTTDPVQKKIMMFVPLIFAIFMKDFPAGLTLYIFVSTLMGMLQQMYVYKRT